MLKYATKLAQTIEGFHEFSFIERGDQPVYCHMGATLTDAVLQAGVSYKSVVRPRINHIQDNYPEAVRTSDFFKLIQNNESRIILKWNHFEKPRRLLSLCETLIREEIETEFELANWLKDPSRRELVLALKGFGPKTVDYLGMLVGAEMLVVDRYMFSLAESVGYYGGYHETQELLQLTAKVLNVSLSALDTSLWTYLSNNRNAIKAIDN